MDNSNFFLPRFGKRNSFIEKQLKKVYFQRKINPEDFPNFKKTLKTFFTDYSQYFQSISFIFHIHNFI